MRTHADLRELLALYAIDALEREETDAIEHHLVTCAACRAELDGLHAAAAALVPDDPSASLPAEDDRLWARIGHQLEGDEPIDLEQVRRTRSGVAPRVAAVVAAAAAVVLLALAVVTVFTDEDPDGLPDVAAEVFDSADSEVVDLVDSSGTPQVRAAIGADGQGYVDLSDLPTLDPDRTYQLWRLDGEEPVSLGLLGDGSASVAGFRLGEGADGLAVSVEPATGVVSPTGPIVASAELS